MRLIISNILGFMASSVSVYSGSINEKKRFLFVQIVMFILFIVSQFLAGAFTGSIVNCLNLFRNFIYYKDKLGKRNKIFLIILMAIATILTNNNGLWGIIPLVACGVFTYYIDIKDMIKFKYLLVFCSVLWFIFDIRFKIYSSSLFDIATVITSLWSARVLIKEKKHV